MPSRRRNVLQPLYPAYCVDDKDTVSAMQGLGMHYCKVRCDTPMYGDCTKIHDCIEDLKGKFVFRRDGMGVQVEYCPICGKRARTRP